MRDNGEGGERRRARVRGRRMVLTRRAKRKRGELAVLRAELVTERAARARSRRRALAALWVGAALVPLGAVALPARIEFAAGEPIVAQQINDNFAALWDEVERIADATAPFTEDTTLSVPEDYATIHEALAALDGRFIHSGVVVTIRVSASGSPRSRATS